MRANSGAASKENLVDVSTTSSTDKMFPPKKQALIK